MCTYIIHVPSILTLNIFSQVACKLWTWPGTTNTTIDTWPTVAHVLSLTVHVTKCPGHCLCPHSGGSRRQLPTLAGPQCCRPEMQRWRGMWSYCRFFPHTPSLHWLMCATHQCYSYMYRYYMDLDHELLMMSTWWGKGDSNNGTKEVLMMAAAEKEIQNLIGRRKNIYNNTCIYGGTCISLSYVLFVIRAK